MTLDPLSVIRIEAIPGGFAAVVVAEGHEADAFAYPNASDPSGIWALRVPIRCEVLT